MVYEIGPVLWRLFDAATPSILAPEAAELERHPDDDGELQSEASQVPFLQ